MARKKVEKAHWTPDEKLRPLTGYETDDDKHLVNEEVALVMTDAQMRATQHEVAQVRVTLEETRQQIKALKDGMAPHSRRETLLLNALVSGTLVERRDVYEYADDAAGIVHQYDPATKEKLGERRLQTWERQHEMNFDADDDDQESDHDAEDEGHA